MLNTMTFGEPNDQPPLVIVHGLFGSARNWGVIAKRLSDTRHVITVDQRNHGLSPWYDSHSYQDMADDLAQIIDRKCDIMGHSMGGKAAMVFALQNPDLVNKLVIADIAPVPYLHSQMSPIDAMRGVDLERVETRGDARDMLVGQPDELRDFFLQSLDIKGKRWKLNLDVLAAEMDKIVGFPDVSGNCTARTLFLSGAASDYVLPAHRPIIKSLFPNSIFAKIPGAGHWLHAQKPREFEAAMRAFLDG